MVALIVAYKIIVSGCLVDNFTSKQSEAKVNNLQVIAARAIAEREAREARGEVEDDEDDTLPTIRVGLVDADGHYTDVEPDL